MTDSLPLDFTLTDGVRTILGSTFTSQRFPVALQEMPDFASDATTVIAHECVLVRRGQYPCNPSMHALPSSIQDAYKGDVTPTMTERRCLLRWVCSHLNGEVRDPTEMCKPAFSSYNKLGGLACSEAKCSCSLMTKCH